MTDSNLSPGRSPVDLVLVNGRIATQDDRRPFVNALAFKGGRVDAIGDTVTVMAYRGAATRVVELNGRTVIPGLIDVHSHPIRGGLFYNLDLRWDGVPVHAGHVRCVKDHAPPPRPALILGRSDEVEIAPACVETGERSRRPAD